VPGGLVDDRGVEGAGRVLALQLASCQQRNAHGSQVILAHLEDFRVRPVLTLLCQFAALHGRERAVDVARYGTPVTARRTPFERATIWTCMRRSGPAKGRGRSITAFTTLKSAITNWGHSPGFPPRKPPWKMNLVMVLFSTMISRTASRSRSR
jgi:hypothetical protein